MPDKYIVTTLHNSGADANSRGVGRAIDLSKFIKGVAVSNELKALAFGTTALATTIVFSEAFSEIPPAAILLQEPLKITPKPLPANFPDISFSSTLQPGTTPSPTRTATPIADQEFLSTTSEAINKNATPTPDNKLPESEGGNLEVKINPLPGVEIKYLGKLSDQNAWKLFTVLLFVYWIPNLYKKILLKHEKTDREETIREFQANIENISNEMQNIKHGNPKGFHDGLDFVVIVNKKETSYSVLKDKAAKIEKAIKSAPKGIFAISKDLNSEINDLYQASMESPISGEIIISRLQNLIHTIENLGLKVKCHCESIWSLNYEEKLERVW